MPCREGGDVVIGESAAAHPTYGRTAGLFERLAGRYDAWYEGAAGRIVFPLEVACLAPLLEGTGRPRAEIGAGSGRFARAVGVEIGLDPAFAPLVVARRRGVLPVVGVGERLPFRDGSLRAALIVVTLCFADDPAALLAETRRVLAPRGILAIGMVPAESPWGTWYRQKGAEGHPFYSVARFLTGEEVRGMLGDAHFRILRVRSTLTQPPSDAPHLEPVHEGEVSGAGFVGLQAR
jgi:SAM-dependent methyltransferase